MLRFLTNRCLSMAVAVFFTAAPCISQDQPPEKPLKSDERTQAPPASEFLVLPLRVIRLKAPDVAEIDCRQLSDDDLRRIVAKVNVIWASAGIHWSLESIEDLPAENTGRVKLAAEFAEENGADDQPAGKTAARLPHSAFRRIIPKSTRENPETFRVHYVHEFDVNGVYFGNREAMVKETARLRTVAGGIDEPLPRVTAHELGHALGLPHRQDTLNLMASGTTGTTLNDAEIRKVRETAAANGSCRKFEELEAESAKATDSGRKSAIQRTVRAIQALAGKPIHPVPAFDLESLVRPDSVP